MFFCLADCPAGQWCTSEKICAPCDDDSHCGMACLDCTDPSINGAHCLMDAADRLVCACQDDDECLAGFWCRPTLAGDIGVCLACISDLHCGENCVDCQDSPVGYACIEGQCGCFANTDCPGPAICRGGVCVEVDGGIVVDGDDQDGFADNDDDVNTDGDDGRDGGADEVIDDDGAPDGAADADGGDDGDAGDD